MSPFILVAADARRPQEYPTDVRELHEQRDRQRCRSNITVCVLDSAGKLVHSFDGMPGQGEPVQQFRQKMAGHCLRELETAKKLLGTLPTAAGEKKLTLPTTAGAGQPAGVRVYLRFGTNHLRHFRVPTVEAVEVSQAERQALAWSAKPKTLSARDIKAWLQECYPPAVMDGKGGFRGITGTLSWKPAGESAEFRYATLSGTISFELDNTGRAKYQGPLEIALTYPKDREDFIDLKGTLKTSIPRQNPEGRTVERVTMDVALEGIASERN